MKFKTPVIILISLIILTAAVLFIIHHSKKVQIINDPTKMQKCDDTGIFTKLSGTKTKAWGFGIENMVNGGSVICIYDGFGKPTISDITYDKNEEANIYVRTDNSKLNQNQVEVIIPNTFKIQVFDSETNASFELFNH